MPKQSGIYSNGNPQYEQQKKNKLKNMKTCDNIKCTNICIIGVQKYEREREKG